jgi:hypothetical protein
MIYRLIETIRKTQCSKRGRKLVNGLVEISIFEKLKRSERRGKGVDGFTEISKFEKSERFGERSDVLICPIT